MGLIFEAGSFLGDAGKNYKRGVGGSLAATYAIDNDVQLTFSAGYLHVQGKSFEDVYLAYKIDDWKALPIRLGTKYFATPHLFLKAETGAVFFLEPGTGTALILSPGIGLQLHHFELAAKLETWTDGGTVSFAGFSLGYFF
ncbi:hypothetical protein [Anseongella ginsenosidimutans]|nr:hypothetical protein [Anseongella ginsenosidimutans]QEC52122.1 hypothetical protein FRZ59_07095 [Anseongella ginsenosidimutans]